MASEKEAEAAAASNRAPAAASTEPTSDGDAKEIKVLSVELADAVAKDKPNYKSWAQISLYMFMLLNTLNCIMNGYDGSVMSSINAMDQWHDFFGVGMDGATLGLVMAIYNAGQVCGSAVAGVIMDGLGRRAVMFFGSCFIVIGSVLQATSQNLPAFIAGRFIVGFGVPPCTIGAITHVVELAYPTWRGLAGGAYNVLGWYIGSLTASWTCYGTGNIQSNWSWRIPYIIQIVPAVIICAVIWFVPESPRWLFAKGKDDVAKAILIKYHGEGNPESAVVKLECEEIRQSLEAEAELTQGKWWDYSVLWKTPAARYRMWIIILVVIFAQFTGGGVISYYLPTILESVGITSSSQQLLMNALNNVFSFCGGIVGTFFVDKAGRRPMLLWGVFISGLVYVPINVLAGLADGHIARDPGYAFIAMMFSYGIVMSFTWTPLQALYPAEILNTDIRAKGLAAEKTAAGLFGFINLYATPIGLKNIGWKMYTVFLSLHVVHWILMYFVTVETKGRSLEELEEIFDDPHPVKRSKHIRRVVVRDGVGVKATDVS